MNAVQSTVARGLLRTLSGFRGYPKGDGEARFVAALCEIAVSVEHAASTLLCFDAEFPTIREMRDAALNLRPKFESKVDQRKEWEAKYGKPDPAFSDRILNAAVGSTAIDPAKRKALHLEEKRAVLWQAIRDSLYYTEGPGSHGPDQFWSAAAEKHKRNHPEEVAAFRVQLQQSGWDTLMAVDWQKLPRAPVRQLRPAPVLIPNAITEADIDLELRKAGRRETGDGE